MSRQWAPVSSPAHCQCCAKRFPHAGVELGTCGRGRSSGEVSCLRSSPCHDAIPARCDSTCSSVFFCESLGSLEAPEDVRGAGWYPLCLPRQVMSTWPRRSSPAYRCLTLEGLDDHFQMGSHTSLSTRHLSGTWILQFLLRTKGRFHTFFPFSE